MDYSEIALFPFFCIQKVCAMPGILCANTSVKYLFSRFVWVNIIANIRKLYDKKKNLNNFWHLKEFYWIPNQTELSAKLCTLWITKLKWKPHRSEKQIGKRNEPKDLTFVINLQFFSTQCVYWIVIDNWECSLLYHS